MDYRDPIKSRFQAESGLGISVQRGHNYEERIETRIPGHLGESTGVLEKERGLLSVG